MSRLFIAIYDYFERRKTLMYSILILLMGVMVFLSLQINFSEDITSFFPDKNKNASIVFNNLKVKDKIIIMVSHKKNSNDEGDVDTLVDAIDKVSHYLSEKIDTSLINNIISEVGDDKIGEVTSFIYNNLPIFINEESYEKLDSLTSKEAIYNLMAINYNKLLSPAGSYLQEYIFTDPIGLSNSALENLQYLNNGSDYQVYDNHLFNADMDMTILFISPKHPIGNTNENAVLVKQIEEVISECVDKKEFEGINIDYFGGPVIAVYNANQIKFDTIITLNIAILIIIIFISLTFKNKWTVVLIGLPVLFGAAFSLSLIYFIKGSISSIAIGSGAAVFGIAMSYSIHVLAHSNHISNRRQIIKDLAYPLTVGSFTTIGAFLGLLFTTSPLLQDFGLFSALTLIGTTLFSLIFLPHFIKENVKIKESSSVLKFIEKISSYEYHKNKPLVIITLLLTFVSLFFFNKVEFNSDMMELNYEPKHIKQAEDKLMSNSVDGMVLFVAADKDKQKAIEAYHRLNEKLEHYHERGEISNISTIKSYVILDSVQDNRISRWREFWTDGKIDTTLKHIENSAKQYGIKFSAFKDFDELIRRDYKSIDYSLQKELSLFNDWINSNDSISLFIAYAPVPDSIKMNLYAELNRDKAIIAADRAYYINNVAEDVNSDFYLILYISTFLILFALLISYGRIELALMSFMPMIISWVLILGLMYLFGIEFNIVNIILSTFIFGIGDDFSIFIMDGMLYEYRTGKKMLSTHKIAIMFSAITVIVGMGSLIFAGHPALKSISVISILGMISVLLVSYTIQPIIFNLLIPKQVKDGGFPHTLLIFLNSFYAFGSFIIGCLLLKIYYLILFISVSKTTRRKMYGAAISLSTKLYMKIMFLSKIIKTNNYGEDFKKPAIIIANHQSFIDILVLMSLNSKFVMLTNNWVWNSPFFGSIVRGAGFYNVSGGYDTITNTLSEKVKEGYSIVVFPEGTRSKDHNIGRFHKGAFYLAEILKLDIIPILLYGNGMICSKVQPLYIKKGYIASEILPRIKFEDTSFGDSYQEKCKNISHYFKNEYENIKNQYNRSSNPYFYDALIKSYIYKGPVLEWYMRVKVKMENSYDLFDKIIPRKGFIVDIGCGYGPLSYMLNMLSPDRRVLGLDYDDEKIEVCENSFLKRENINFETVDVCDYKLPNADAFVINDMLHYMNYDRQEVLIKDAISSVNIGGVVVIRDGDSEDIEHHKLTKKSEKWSTGIVGFNRIKGDIYFTSTTRLKNIISEFDVELEIIKNDNKTSNTIYVITKKS